jgi:hypothetical protein
MFTDMKPHAEGAKDATQASSRFWTAAGSEAPRRFRARGVRGQFEACRPLKSGVAAALCHRSPRLRMFQAGGWAEISRVLSGATLPENVETRLHSEGVPEFGAWFDAAKPLRPLQGRVRRQFAGGVARRLAQPPANVCQPSGLIRGAVSFTRSFRACLKTPPGRRVRARGLQIPGKAGCPVGPVPRPGWFSTRLSILCTLRALCVRNVFVYE